MCRNKLSPASYFRNALAELGRILIYEAAKDWLPSVAGQVETPFGLADVQFIDPNKPVKVLQPPATRNNAMSCTSWGFAEAHPPS